MLPVGFAALLAVGTVAAALGGRLGATGVLIACAVVVGALAAVAEPTAAIPLGVIGWLTAVGFSRPPYADLRMTGGVAGRAAVTLAVVALGAAVVGGAFRWRAAGVTLESVDRHEHSGLSPRRQVAGAVLAVAGLPSLTALLNALQPHLNLSDDLLIYLVAVVAVTVVGGFWPAVVAAVGACLLLNWFFTAPVHTFTIAEPRNLLALVLFVTVAVAVSSVVHLAARRESDAARSAKETESLLGLAQTVLGGADTPGDVLDHLTASHGGHAELLERVGGRWIKVASSGELEPGLSTQSSPGGATPRTPGACPVTPLPGGHPRTPGRMYRARYGSRSGPISPSRSAARRRARRPPCSPGTPRRPSPHSTGPGCALRRLRPRRSRKATGCGPHCCAR